MCVHFTLLTESALPGWLETSGRWAYCLFWPAITHFSSVSIIIRPGVAGAVLQTPPSLVNWVILFGNIFHTLSFLNRKRYISDILIEGSSLTMCHMSCVTCHVSHVLCHMSCITCHVSHVMCHIPCVTCYISHVMCHMSCVTCHVSHVMCQMSHVTCHMSNVTWHMSCVTCQVSHFTCPISHVMCHMSFFYSFFLYFIFLDTMLSQWRVCYLQGLHRLDFLYFDFRF